MFRIFRGCPDPPKSEDTLHICTDGRKKVTDPLVGIVFGRVSIRFLKLFPPDPRSNFLGCVPPDGSKIEKKVMDPLGGIVSGRVSIRFLKLFPPDPRSRSLYYLVVTPKTFPHVYHPSEPRSKKKSWTHSEE